MDGSYAGPCYGLPQPPTEALAFGAVSLRLDRIKPGDDSRGFVPHYHFRIMTADDADAGHINFRVGDTDHVRYFAGHVGFAVRPEFRGRGFAGQACHALAPFIRSIYDEVTITCDPDNLASRRTIDQLGAHFVDEGAAPIDDHPGQEERRVKRRYRWSP